MKQLRNLMVLTLVVLVCSCGKKEQLRPKNEPTLAATAHIAQIIDEVEKRLPAEKKTEDFVKQVIFAKGIGLGKAELFLYTGKKTGLQPVLFVYGPRDKYESLLTVAPLKDYLIKDGDSYRINTDKVPEKQRGSIDLNDYRITYNGSAFVFAPQSLAAQWHDPIEKPQNSTALTTAEDALNDKTLGAFAFFIPKNLSTNIKKDIAGIKGLGDLPGSKMYMGIFSGIVDMLVEPFKDIKALGASFQYEQDSRILNYVQVFREESQAKHAYSLINAESTDVANELVSNLMEQLYEGSLEKDLSQDDDKLNVKLSWQAKDDKVVGQSFISATVGYVFRNFVGGGMKPTEGTIETKYTTEPLISEDVEIEQWKILFASQVQTSVFPDHYWEDPNDPKMSLQLDYLKLPNTTLTEVVYEVRSVVDTSGKDILRKVESQFPNKMNFDWVHGTKIQVPVQLGTQKEDLVKAKVLFKVSAPKSVHIVEFKASDKENIWKKSGPVKVKVIKIENDVAAVNFRGGKSAKVIAYDKTGKALAHNSSTWSESSWSGKFRGVISFIKVVVNTEKVEYEHEVWFDLNKGESLKLPQEPSETVRLRYDYNTENIYNNIIMQDLKGLKVEWEEASEKQWNDNLIIKMPKKKVRGNAQWQVNFFGRDKSVLLKGSSSSSNGDYVYSMKKGELAQANRAFGKVKLSFDTDIKRLEVIKKSDGKELKIEVKPGVSLTVVFNKNQINYKLPRDGDLKELNIAAFDKSGNKLKSESAGGAKAYWGIPVKFIVTIALTTIEKSIDFDLEERPVNEVAFLGYQAQLEKQKDIYTILKDVHNKCRRYIGSYGESLAALHFLRKKESAKEPMSLILQEIAHSDPLGQQRFGYKLKPYKGYFFSLTKGKMSNGVKKQYARGDEREFFWGNGSFKSKRFRENPLITATPVDPKQPSFIVVWSDVMIQLRNGEPLEYAPDNYYQEWIKLNY